MVERAPAAEICGAEGSGTGVLVAIGLVAIGDVGRSTLGGATGLLFASLDDALVEDALVEGALAEAALVLAFNDVAGGFAGVAGSAARRPACCAEAARLLE